MHELGLCASIVDAIERRAGDRPVSRVRVRAGRLLHVHPEAFDQSFAVAAMGTVAADAVAELVLLPVRARCSACAAGLGVRRGAASPVPACGSVEVELVGGDELVLESIEYRG